MAPEYIFVYLQVLRIPEPCRGQGCDYHSDKSHIMESYLGCIIHFLFCGRFCASACAPAL